MVEREENVIDLYCVVTTISTAICVFSFTVIILYYSVVLKQDTRTACINSIFAVVYTFTFRQVQTCYVWLNRKKDYNTLMKNPIINYSAIAIFSIIMYILGFKTYVLFKRYFVTNFKFLRLTLGRGKKSRGEKKS